MSAPTAAHPHATGRAPDERRVAFARAAVGLLWAIALVLALGDDGTRTDADVPVAAALLLAAYPVVDVLASIRAASAGGVPGRLARANAALGVLAVAAVAVAALAADAGATLAAFGAWAAISGALQLVVAVRRRSEGRQLPMIISGGLSTLAGLSFVAAAARTEADLVPLAGYMAVGAVLYVVWGVRTRGTR
ncbi:hypothetical protein [Patulibacter sp.]|uniref:hypothetical protein n=1 Tax=Patulibacter sp. TaxID=1912859 RepID=UPI00271D833D|nr:hypothetical protein [Patulibacter sp.]MDO9410331.1 hypothetical protein [Patulibacter sp.]